MTLKPATIGQFLAAFFSSWMSWCSGGLSVPLTALAIYLDNVSAKITFGILAALSFLAACLFVWRAERNVLIKVSADLEKERGNRPKPQLFVERKSATTPFQYPGFEIVNKGITAVNVTFSRITTGSVSVQLESVPILHSEQPRALFFQLLKEGAPLHVFRNNFRSLVEMMCNEMNSIDRVST